MSIIKSILNQSKPRKDEKEQTLGFLCLLEGKCFEEDAREVKKEGSTLVLLF